MYPKGVASPTFSRLTQVDLFVKLSELIIDFIINGLDCITLFISAFDSKYISEKLHPSNGTIPPIYMPLFSDVNISSPREFLKLYIGIIIGRRAYSSTESFRLDIPRLNGFFFTDADFQSNIPSTGSAGSVGFSVFLNPALSILNLPKRGPR